MFVEERGPVGGRPIVFLHGSMVAGWMWTEQVESLSQTHRTIVPDLPGLGKSGSERWISFAETAKAVADELTTRAPDGAHIVGLSLGGIIALHLGVSHPDACKSILVSGVPAGTLPVPLRLLNRLMAAAYGTRAGAQAIARMFGMPDQESRDAFVATAHSTSREAIRAIVDEVSEAPLPDGLDAISAPLLAVVGSKDTAAARQAVHLLADTVSGARGARVEGVGHQWNAEAPDLFSDMVRTWVDDRRVDDRLTEVTS